MYPYPFLVEINRLLSYIIFINDCIFILTGSHESYFSLLYMLYKNWGKEEFSKFPQRNDKLTLP